MNVALNLILAATIVVAAFIDIKERRVPNWLIVSAVCAGFVLGALQGSTHLLLSIGGFAAGVAALFIPFAFGWMGAGDVKLFGAVGALLGYTSLPRVLFYSCIVAGSVALFALAFGYARHTSFKQLWTDCKFMLLTLRGGFPKGSSLESGAYSVPWGVAIGAGTIMAYYLDPAGTWAGF
jgi:prepilin peptidase CpaA